MFITHLRIIVVNRSFDATFCNIHNVKERLRNKFVDRYDTPSDADVSAANIAVQAQLIGAGAPQLEEYL